MKIPEPTKTKNGSYRIQLRLNGVSIPVTASTRKEVIRQAGLIKSEYLNNVRSVSSHSGKTVGDAVDEYITFKKEIEHITERSQTEYEQIKNNRFKSLMNMKISSLNNQILQDAVNAEQLLTTRKGGQISVKTVKSAYSLIASSINRVDRNINTKVQFKEVQRKFKDLLSPEEVYKAVKDTDVELPVLLAMWLSLSISEIRGLTKSKSIRGNQIYIVETVVDTVARDDTGKPIKDENGKQKRIALRKDGGKEVFRPRVLEMPKKIQDLINAVAGDVIEPRSSHAVYCRFQRVLASAGLPAMRFHDLRHINASIMADLDIPEVVAQERGGWKTPDVMKSVYTHSFSKSRKDADKKIDAYFDSIINK